MTRVLLASASAMLVVALAGPAWSQGRPQIATTKVEGTDNVYIFRNGNHQAMFVVTKDGVIATDPIAYGRPTGGQAYVDEIKKVTDKPIKYLIYSHHHWDHAAGAAVYADTAQLVGHANMSPHLAMPPADTPLPQNVRAPSIRPCLCETTTAFLTPNS